MTHSSNCKNRNMLSALRYYFDLLIDFIFGLYYKNKMKRIPKPLNPLVMQSAITLARKIRNGELTSEEVVTAFIDRINQVNPLTNAVVDHRFSEALDEARKIDEDIASGNFSEEDFARKPFLGVPFTTKEVIAAKGLSHTLGLMSRKSHKAPDDAEVTQKIKSAGAILLGVTNAPQLSAWTETSNPIYGTTCNPYNTSRTAGGSSGGEACNVAACGSAFGIASDLGGSIRNPSFACGIYGHKTSSNLVSVQGLMFNESDLENNMASVGPMTKYAEDLLPLVKVLVGDCSKLKLDENVDVKSVRICYVTNPGDPHVSPFRDEMSRVMTKCVQYFSAFSQEPPVLLNIEELKHGGEIWFHLVEKTPNKCFTSDLTNRQGQVDRFKEMFKYCIGRSDFNIFVMAILICELLPRTESEWVKDIISTLQEKLTTALGTNGVLLYPSAPMAASYHYTTIFRPYNVNLYSVWNALNFVVTQVPMGLNKEGMPLGIQVVAPLYQDRLTIAVARELERAFGGYVPPFETEG